MNESETRAKFIDPKLRATKNHALTHVLRPHPLPLPRNGGGEKGEGAKHFLRHKKPRTYARGLESVLKKCDYM